MFGVPVRLIKETEVVRVDVQRRYLRVDRADSSPNVRLPKLGELRMHEMLNAGPTGTRMLRVTTLREDLALRVVGLPDGPELLELICLAVQYPKLITHRSLVTLFPCLPDKAMMVGVDRRLFEWQGGEPTGPRFFVNLYHREKNLSAARFTLVTRE